MLVRLNQADQMSSIDFSNIEQIKTDWEMKPFVDISVQSTPCESSGTENLFESVSGGTQRGCYVYNDPWHTDHIETENYFRTHHNNDDDYARCTMISGSRPMVQSNPFGLYICGKRGGTPFVSVNRPDPKTKLCPEAMKPCSTSTSVEDTVCYPSNELKENCPINYFEFSNRKVDTNSTERVVEG